MAPRRMRALAVPCACAALLAAVSVRATLAATSPLPAGAPCPGYFAIAANASYYDFKAVGTYPPGKKRARTPEEAAAFLAGALEPAEPELSVLQTNTSMIVVGFSHVTEVALSTADGRSLADPAKRYPWTGQARLVVLDALGDLQMPLTGGSLPEPGGEGSAFDSPLFITVKFPGPTEEALAILEAATPQWVNNQTYSDSGMPLQDTLALHQELYCEAANASLLLTKNEPLPPYFKPQPDGVAIKSLQDVTALNPVLAELLGVDQSGPPIPLNTTQTYFIRRVYWPNYVNGRFVSSLGATTPFASLEDARAGVNPLGPTQVTTGLENPATTPGTPPEVYADDPELLAAAQRDVGVAMASIQSALVTNATDVATGDD